MDRCQDSDPGPDHGARRWFASPAAAVRGLERGCGGCISAARHRRCGRPSLTAGGGSTRARRPSSLLAAWLGNFHQYDVDLTGADDNPKVPTYLPALCIINIVRRVVLARPPPGGGDLANSSLAMPF